MLRDLRFKAVVAWRRSLWPLPALIVAGAMALGFALVLADPSIAPLESLSGRLFTVSADGARGVLTAIATSMLSVAGVVFSITIATLSLTSQQFTSRVLRMFVQDRGNQAVLGVFLGVFAYCLVVLRAVRSPSDGPGYVPQFAMLVAIALAIVGVGFLIYFIDHVALSIQASSIISRIAHDTQSALEAEADEAPGDGVPDELHDGLPGDWEMGAVQTGYIRGVDLKALAALARKRDWLLVVATPGTFLVEGATLLRVRARGADDRQPGDEDLHALRAAVHLAASGDIAGDATFGVRQLVDIALKALSPGVNDVTTALICLDYLGAVLLVAARRSQPVAAVRDEVGTVRVLMPRSSFGELVREALEQIREAGSSQAVVLLREIDVLTRLLEMGRPGPRRRVVLWKQADAIERAARRALGDGEGARQTVAAAARLKHSLMGSSQ